MAGRSAGILLYRRTSEGLRMLLGHLGGPFWARRDAGAWTVPKGEYEPDERPEDAARREFEEELGVPPPGGALLALGQVRQSGGKSVTVWALEGEIDLGAVVLGTFELEWPRGSGTIRTFPELDRIEWFDLDRACAKLVPAQQVFPRRLLDRLA